MQLIMNIHFQLLPKINLNILKKFFSNNYGSNILFLGPIEDHGGIGSVIKQYKIYFKNARFITTYPDNEKNSKLFEFIKAILNTTKAIWKDKNLRILHIHCASKGSFYRKSVFVLLGKFLKKKIIMHMHGGGFKDFYYQNILTKLFTRSILSLADKVICLSGEWNDFYTNEMKLSNTTTISNAVELKPIYKNRNYDGAIKLLFMGKICNEKGVFDLINFLGTNKYFLNGKILLTICGIGQESKILELISNPLWGKYIEYKGWVEGEKKNNIIKDTDIYILPSHFEGVPISILEAMAYGKPIIATRVGGNPSLVKNYYNGWIVDPGDLNNLGNIFEQIFREPEILKLYGRNSYLASQEYNPKNIFKKLEELYEELICI